MDFNSQTIGSQQPPQYQNSLISESAPNSIDNEKQGFINIELTLKQSIERRKLKHEEILLKLKEIKERDG